MYSVQRTVYSEHCTVYSVQCTVNTVQCTLYSVQYSAVHLSSGRPLSPPGDDLQQCSLACKTTSDIKLEVILDNKMHIIFQLGEGFTHALTKYSKRGKDLQNRLLDLIGSLVE